jgi:hypothetical protein
MSEIVERMARAAYERYNEQLNVGLDPKIAAKHFNAWEALQPWTRTHYIEAQRAALAVLHEPTEAMIQSARSSAPYDRDVTETWPIMIDEALK